MAENKLLISAVRTLYPIEAALRLWYNFIPFTQLSFTTLLCYNQLLKTKTLLMTHKTAALTLEPQRLLLSNFSKLSLPREFLSTIPLLLSQCVGSFTLC